MAHACTTVSIKGSRGRADRGGRRGGSASIMSDAFFFFFSEGGFSSVVPSRTCISAKRFVPSCAKGPFLRDSSAKNHP